MQGARQFTPSFGAAGQDNGPPIERRRASRRSEDQRLAAIIRRQNKARNIRAAAAYFILALLAVISIIGFGANDYGDISIKNISSKVNAMLEEEKKLDINGLSLGMTPDAVREVFPNLSLSLAGNGAAKGNFSENGANYSIAFQDEGGVKRVARIQYDQAFKTMTETQILERLGEKFGNPISADCARGDLSKGVNCNFMWWVKGGATLNAAISQVTLNSSETGVKLAMTVVDSYLEGKKTRAAQGGQKNKKREIAPITPPIAPPIAPMAASAPRAKEESLPF